MKDRHVFFSLDMSTELEDEVTELILRARVTLIENGFAKACFQSVENPAAARDDINKQIRGFGDARAPCSPSLDNFTLHIGRSQ